MTRNGASSSSGGHVGVDDPDHVVALDRAVDARLPTEALHQLGRQQRARQHHLERQVSPVFAWTTS